MLCYDENFIDGFNSVANRYIVDYLETAYHLIGNSELFDGVTDNEFKQYVYESVCFLVDNSENEDAVDYITKDGAIDKLFGVVCDFCDSKKI